MEKEMSEGSGDDHPIIRFRDVTKVYPLPAGDVVALDHVSLAIGRGEFIAIMGPSGSGKSTLLNLIGCLDVPTEGDLWINGNHIRELSDEALTLLRRDTIGFVFQQFNLIPLFSVVENVEFPLILKTRAHTDRKDRPEQVLREVDLDQKLWTHKPSELSGGQQQRVAIARAMINDPDILLCDEPTGNLDTRTGKGIMEILSQMNRRGKTIIMVTHDPKIAEYAKRAIELVDGRIV
jgi:putative ABC transport system ATP-binding protein